MVQSIELQAKLSQSQQEIDTVMSFQLFSPENHYKILADWWTAHKWGATPLESLPKNGLVIYHGDIPVCSGFIYSTDSNISWLEWVLCDRKADRAYRGKCLDYLIVKLIKMAKHLGFTTIFTSVEHPFLLKRLCKHGFGENDKGMTNLLKVL